MPLGVSKCCPDCHETTIAPSKPRKWHEAIWNLFPLTRMYRCHNCNWRGRLFQVKIHRLGRISNIVFIIVGFVFIIGIATLIFQVFFAS